MKGAFNTLAPWRRDSVGVAVTDGFDEIALALTVDAIARTIRGKPVTWSETGAPVRGRQGLQITVDRARSAVRDGTREIVLAPSSQPEAAALDFAIARLTAWYGGDAAELIALGMEYRHPQKAP